METLETDNKFNYNDLQITNIKNTNQIITEYIKEQCHHQKIDNAIIILPENINIELLKTNDNIEIQHYKKCQILLTKYNVYK